MEDVEFFRFYGKYLFQQNLHKNGYACFERSSLRSRCAKTGHSEIRIGYGTVNHCRHHTPLLIYPKGEHSANPDEYFNKLYCPRLGGTGSLLTPLEPEGKPFKDSRHQTCRANQNKPLHRNRVMAVQEHHGLHTDRQISPCVRLKESARSFQAHAAESLTSHLCTPDHSRRYSIHRDRSRCHRTPHRRSHT